MRKYVIFLISLFLTVIVFGQSQSTVEVEKDLTSPKFIGTENVVFSLDDDNSVLISKYLKENICCPERVAECLVEGTEIVQFTVNQCGGVSDFKVINSVCPELDKEVIRVLQTTNGLWDPGRKYGEPVTTDVEVAFMFGIYPDRNSMVKRFCKNAASCYISGGKNLFLKNNPKKALKCYNNGINYMPNDKALLLMRGFCLYELGDKESALRDWNRIVALGGIAPEQIDDRIINLKGYDELTRLTKIDE